MLEKETVLREFGLSEKEAKVTKDAAGNIIANGLTTTLFYKSKMILTLL